MKTLAKLQAPKEAENSPVEEASAASAASTSASASSAPPSKSTRKAKAKSEETAEEEDPMKLLIQKKAMEKVSKEQADFELNCHTALGILFMKLSLVVKNTLEAKHSELETWRNEGKLISVWEALAAIYGMRNTVFPQMLKIGAESLRIRPEENISSFIIKKENLMHDVLEQGLELNDQDYIWSLMYGLAHDQRIRLFVEPFFTFKNKIPDTYEDFKAELNHWTTAQERLNTRSGGSKISSKPDNSSSTVLAASGTKVKCSYCHKTGHLRENCFKRNAAEVDNGSRKEQPTRLMQSTRFQPRSDRDPQRTEYIGYTEEDDQVNVYEGIIY